MFGDWEGGSIRGTNSTPCGRSENKFSTWAVGGRAGYLVTPRFLTYFDGGFTQARFDQINYNVSGVGVLGGPTGVSVPAQTYNGWFVGSGFEYAFDWLPIPGLFLKTEYRYAQYNTATPSFVPGWWRADRRLAQLDEVHPVCVDRTGVALQLVRRSLLIDAELLRQEPGTKVPGFLFRALLASSEAQIAVTRSCEPHLFIRRPKGTGVARRSAKNILDSPNFGTSICPAFGGRGHIMKAKIVTAAALVILAGFGSAGAADLPLPAPVYKAPPPPVYNWTGCYIGGGGLAMAGGTRIVRLSLKRPAFLFPAEVTNGGKGWFGQGQAGCATSSICLWGTRNLPVVIGVFGDWEGGSIRVNTKHRGACRKRNEFSTWAVGGRAGYLVTPRFLTYFDGGYTQARFDQINYNFSVAGGGPSGFSLPPQTYNGWFIGSGFEYAFDWLPIPGLFLKTEYRYAQYNTATPNFLFMNAPAAISLNSTKFTQFVSTELVWRFNWWGGRY